MQTYHAYWNCECISSAYSASHRHEATVWSNGNTFGMLMRTVVIIEDEQDARDTMRQYLQLYPELVLLNECDNGRQAIECVNSLKPDIVFIDIHLPGIHGFQVIEQFMYKPAIIISSAFIGYALKAFNYDAIDYLLKPFSADRFDVAVGKALQYLEQQALHE